MYYHLNKTESNFQFKVTYRIISKFTLEKKEEIEYNNEGYKSASVAELVDALFSGSSGSSRVGSSPTSCTKIL